MRRAQIALLLLGSGCAYTTTNTVTLSPLETKYPVSASAEYLDAEGRIVAARDYKVIMPFMFPKDIDGARHAATESKLELAPALDRLVEMAEGNAITKLRVEAVSYDSGAHASAAYWRSTGLHLAIAGGLLLIPGLVSLDSENEKVPMTLLPASAACFGAGALLLLLGNLAKTPSRWHFRVSGEVVHSRLVAPTPAPIPPPSPDLVEPPAEPSAPTDPQQFAPGDPP